MSECLSCKKSLPDRNQVHSDAHATPLTYNVQSLLLYFSQLLYWNIYQLRQKESDKDRQISLNLGLIKGAVEIIEGMLDQVLVTGLQFRFIERDYCKECGLKKINEYAKASGWPKYKEYFDSLFFATPISKIFSDIDLEAISMLFLLRHFMVHCQPLRATQLSGDGGDIIVSDLIELDHKKLLAFFKKKKILPTKNKIDEWTWDFLLQDEVLLWATSTAKSFCEKLGVPGVFPLWQYVRDMNISIFPDIRKI